MKRGKSLVLLLLSLSSSAFSQVGYKDKIQHQRDSINQVFADTSTSILPKSEIDTFHGLHYFPVDEQYVVSAKFKKRKGKPFFMPTSTTRLPVYTKIGVLKFKVDGVKCQLYVYNQIAGMDKDSSISEYGFIPFRDATTNNQSYGSGRYMDIKLSELGKTVVIDFNTCYNPYCAYSSRYSCPITPKENTLPVPIKAGVKKWHK